MTGRRGQVVDNDPLVEVVLLLPNGERRAATAVVDTGMQAAIDLPAELFDAARRGRVEPAVTELADGTPAAHPRAVVAVEFCGERRFVNADRLADQVLIGMTLLRGHRLTVECREGGPVTIEPLSQSPA